MKIWIVFGGALLMAPFALIRVWALAKIQIFIPFILPSLNPAR